MAFFFFLSCYRASYHPRTQGVAAAQTRKKLTSHHCRFYDMPPVGGNVKTAEKRRKMWNEQLKKIKKWTSRKAEFGAVHDGGDVNETPDTDASMLTTKAVAS